MRSRSSPCFENIAPCSPCCFCRRTVRSWPPSSESGSWPAAGRRTTVSSPPWTKGSPLSQRALTAGEHPTRCCVDYAALFKTLCLVMTCRRFLGRRHDLLDHPSFQSLLLDLPGLGDTSPTMSAHRSNSIELNSNFSASYKEGLDLSRPGCGLLSLRESS